MGNIKLGVNIDHVATLRQARRIGLPDICEAAKAAAAGGADGITIHLREDRRHIQDDDLIKLAPLFRLNLEMACTDEMVFIACGSKGVKPNSVCIVPEKREELTTEGGLDVISKEKKLAEASARLKKSGIAVSFFIEPDPWQIEASAKAGAEFVELHTGRYANMFSSSDDELEKEKKRLIFGAKTAVKLGLRVNAGHGLDLRNVKFMKELEGIEELNIGFSIVARSVFIGLENAVREMKKVISE